MGAAPVLIGLAWGRRAGDKAGDWLTAEEVERMGSRIHHRLQDGRVALRAIPPADLQRAITGDRGRRKWTPGEDRAITGATTAEARAVIADALGRSVDSVKRRQRRLAKRGG